MCNITCKWMIPHPLLSTIQGQLLRSVPAMHWLRRGGGGGEVYDKVWLGQGDKGMCHQTSIPVHNIVQLKELKRW